MTTKQETTSLERYINAAVFIRTVTHHYTGALIAYDAHWIVLHDAAWIADDGRFADFLKTGEAREVEPYPDGPVLIGVGAVLDISFFTHPLPRKQK
jgi:hypothetical protein